MSVLVYIVCVVVSVYSVYVWSILSCPSHSFNNYDLIKPQYSPGFLDMYPQLNRVRLKISALTNSDMGNNILKVPKLPTLGFCINYH